MVELTSKIKLVVIGIFLLALPGAGSVQTARSLEISGTIIQITAFLLAMCGSLYLASVLWSRGEKGAESWKYISISMIMFAVWNIEMTFGIMIAALHIQSGEGPDGDFEKILNIINILDPVIEVIVFIILLFGLHKIIKMMRTKPWEVFGKVESDE